MPVSLIPKALRLLVKVAVVYILVFVIWIFAAPQYHLFLGHVAARLIPLVVSSDVNRVWYDTGVHYKIEFETRDSGLDLAPTQTITADAVVDTLHFGYPIITFLVLALALPGPPWRTRALGIVLGSAIIVLFYSSWMVIAVYQYMSGIEIRFLQENWLVRLIPPTFYGRYERGFLVFFGQVLPIATYAALLFRPHWSARKSPSPGLPTIQRAS